MKGGKGGKKGVNGVEEQECEEPEKEMSSLQMPICLLEDARYIKSLERKAKEEEERMPASLDGSYQ